MAILRNYFWVLALAVLQKVPDTKGLYFPNGFISPQIHTCITF